MKTRLLSLFLILAMVQGACALLGGGAAVDATATLPPRVTNAPTEAPSSTPAAVQPTVTQPAPTQSALAPTQPEPVAPKAPAEVGPETLDLSEPALFQNSFTEYTDQMSADITGLDSSGESLTMHTAWSTRFQSQPSVAWYTTTSDNLFGEEVVVESAAVDGQLYSLQPGSDCTQSAAGDPPQGAFSLLPSALTGTAQRVETGVEINGMLTDRYAIQADNLVPNAEINLRQITSDGESTITSTVTIRLSGSGSLFRLREGGFAVRLEILDAKTATEEDFFFKVGSEMKANRQFDLIPTAPGASPIAPPAGCGTTPPATEQSYPMMDDASMVVQESGQLVYQTNHTLVEAKAFYLTEMVAAGWTKAGETTVGPIVELTFTKDDQTASVTLMQTGAMVTVTVTSG